MGEWRCSSTLSDPTRINSVNKLCKVAFSAQKRSLKDKKGKKKLKGLNGSFEFGSSETEKPLSQQADVLPANNDAAALKHWG